MTVEEAIDAAERLLPGRPAPEGDIDPRWQAMIRIADFIPSDPAAVWRFVRRWGGDPQEDVRSAVATCVLEHLLETHFASCFAEVSSLARRDRLFAATLHACWSTLNAERTLKLRELGDQLSTLWGCRLDDLVPDDEPHGTFHDAWLSDIKLDRKSGICTCAVELSVGDPDDPDAAARDRVRAGRLTLHGVRICNLPEGGDAPADRLWLTTHGLLEQCPVAVDRAVLEAARGSKVAWFLFLADRNSYAYVAADSARFTWC